MPRISDYLETIEPELANTAQLFGMGDSWKHSGGTAGRRTESM